MSDPIPAPCRTLLPDRPGQRTRSGRQPRTGVKRDAPSIAWIDEGLEVFSIEYSGQRIPFQWSVMRKEPNDLHAAWVEIGTLSPDAKEGHDFGEQVGCYYVVGVGGDGKWQTGRSNILCNWTEAIAGVDKRFFG